MNSFDIYSELYPAARLGNRYLIIRGADIQVASKDIHVLSISVDPERKEIGKPESFQNHLKFNPWEEITNGIERENVISEIFNHFNEQTIIEKIINPLNRIKEKVFVSGLLRQVQDFYPYFRDIITNHDLESCEIDNTRDIWCRDYMPVKNRLGFPLLFNYDPIYLKGKWSKLLTPRMDIIKFLDDNNISFENIENIRLDGGNVVRSKEYVIITDKIFIENELKTKEEQNKLQKRLEDWFMSSIIIIPHQPDDTLGHADGVIRFLDESTVLVNNFSGASIPKYRESKRYIDNLFGTLGKAGLNIIQVPYVQ